MQSELLSHLCRSDCRQPPKPYTHNIDREIIEVHADIRLVPNLRCRRPWSILPWPRIPRITLRMPMEIHKLEMVTLLQKVLCLVLSLVSSTAFTMSSQRPYALTICGYRKPGMDEDEYHHYLSEHHAEIVKNHLVNFGIITYTLVSLSMHSKATLTLPDPQHQRVKEHDETHLWQSPRGKHRRLRLLCPDRVPRCRGLRPRPK